jgi:hypothetical protein
VWLVLGLPTTGSAEPGIAVSTWEPGSGEPAWLSEGGGEDAADEGSERGWVRLTLVDVTLSRGNRGIGSLVGVCVGPVCGNY